MSAGPGAVDTGHWGGRAAWADDAWLDVCVCDVVSLFEAFFCSLCLRPPVYTGFRRYESYQGGGWRGRAFGCLDWSWL